MAKAEPIKSIVIAGGGTSGWMTAAALSRMLLPENVSITLIESENIGTIGVGEATVPNIANFNRMLGVEESHFMQASEATFKLGIEFSDWGKIGDKYVHPFGTHGVDMNGIDFHQYLLHANRHGYKAKLDDFSVGVSLARHANFMLPNSDTRSVFSHLRYAYHFNAGAYAQYLRRYSEENGVNRIEGTIEHVLLNKHDGNIQSLVLTNQEKVEADFFIDCSGFKALLLEKTLGVKFNDWSHWLPCNRAQTITSTRTEPLLPYTKSMAKKCGWQWRIPTQKRTGNGHIYCSSFISDDEANHILKDGLDSESIGDARTINFQTGCREAFWYKNCVGIGLSSGFLEPLESTSIFLIQQGISHFISLYPIKDFDAVLRKKYNDLMTKEFNQVRDFIILHYKSTLREDSQFWNYCRSMSIPDSLKEKIDLFRAGGRVFRENNEFFSKPSWVAVLLGQQVVPELVDPILHDMPPQEVVESLNSMKFAIEKAAASAPAHQDFIQRYAKTEN